MGTTGGYTIPDKEVFVIFQGGYSEMNDNDWIRNIDGKTMQYIVSLQEINKSLIETLKAYGNLLKKVKFEGEHYEEIKKAIDNIDRVVASAEKVDLFQKITRH